MYYDDIGHVKTSLSELQKEFAVSYINLHVVLANITTQCVFVVTVLLLWTP